MIEERANEDYKGNRRILSGYFRYSVLGLNNIDVGRPRVELDGMAPLSGVYSNRLRRAVDARDLPKLITISQEFLREFYIKLEKEVWLEDYARVDTDSIMALFTTLMQCAVSKGGLLRDSIAELLHAIPYSPILREDQTSFLAVAPGQVSNRFWIGPSLIDHNLMVSFLSASKEFRKEYAPFASHFFRGITYRGLVMVNDELKVFGDMVDRELGDSSGWSRFAFEVDDYIKNIERMCREGSGEVADEYARGEAYRIMKPFRFYIQSGELYRRNIRRGCNEDGLFIYPGQRKLFSVAECVYYGRIDGEVLAAGNINNSESWRVPSMRDNIDY